MVQRMAITFAYNLVPKPEIAGPVTQPLLEEPVLLQAEPVPCTAWLTRIGGAKGVSIRTASGPALRRKIQAVTRPALAASPLLQALLPELLLRKQRDARASRRR